MKLMTWNTLFKKTNKKSSKCRHQKVNIYKNIILYKFKNNYDKYGCISHDNTFVFIRLIMAGKSETLQNDDFIIVIISFIKCRNSFQP